VMDWLNARLKRAPDLKVILLYGPDPADTTTGFLREALDNHLYPGLNVDQYAIHQWFGTTVHCKVVIVDDMWCAIGSANCARRSLYTDIELSVAIANADFAAQFRCDLWAGYCRRSPRARTPDQAPQRPTPADLMDLELALGIWKPKWGKKRARRDFELRAKIAWSGDPVGTFNQVAKDLADADSRMTF
jgi:phosphatidylserine/phosphatidylglycerophosphate/cardiolipin synthase-like enzyme